MDIQNQKNIEEKNKLSKIGETVKNTKAKQYADNLKLNRLNNNNFENEYNNIETKSNASSSPQNL